MRDTVIFMFLNWLWIFMFYWLSNMSDCTLAAMDEINDNDNYNDILFLAQLKEYYFITNV
jgi:hypothetical protein